MDMLEEQVLSCVGDPEETAMGPDNLGEAEAIANIVTAGLENASFSEMNKQLASVAQGNDGRKAYVFEDSGIAWQSCCIVICAVLSVLFAYCLLIGIGTILLSSNHRATGILLVAGSLFALLANATLIPSFLSTIRRKGRIDSYGEVLGYKTHEFVEDLAACTKKGESVVVKDLKWAIDQKLIPQGHFSRDNLVFMISDEAYDKYSSNPAVYDRYFQKKIEDRRRAESRTEAIAKIMEEGELFIEKTRGYRTLVKDKSVAKKIGRMESVASMILHEIGADPDQARTLGLFLNYYLPSSEKLLEAYVSLCEKKVDGPRTSKTKKEIESAFDTISMAFEGVLEKLYREKEDDIASDIAALELSIKQEGLPIQS